MHLPGTEHSLSFDISIDSDSGTRAVELVQEYMNGLPGLQQLAMVVEQILKVTISLVCVDIPSHHCTL